MLRSVGRAARMPRKRRRPVLRCARRLVTGCTSARDPANFWRRHPDKTAPAEDAERDPVMGDRKIKINLAPVLTLWAAVVAERLGYDWQTAVTLGKAVGGSERTGQRAAAGHLRREDRGREGS